MQHPQIPGPGEVVLDHLAHFVPDLDAAAGALRALGFTATPRTPQMNAAADGTLVAAGTENRCVMLEAGYLEFLTPVADTPLATRMRAALDHGTGLHLVCFGSAEADPVQSRLDEAGFAPDQPVRLRRTVGLAEGGEGELRFSVIRVPPAAMPEGRIQYVVHHTPDLLWQERWLGHPNGALALTEVALVVADPVARAERYAAFTGRSPREIGNGAVIDLDRGRVILLSPERWRAICPTAPVPDLPWIAGYGLRVADLERAVEAFGSGGAAIEPRPAGALTRLPDALGGVVMIGEADDGSFLSPSEAR
jgi:hypothetical protein